MNMDWQALVWAIVGVLIKWIYDQVKKPNVPVPEPLPLPVPVPLPTPVPVVESVSVVPSTAPQNEEFYQNIIKMLLVKHLDKPTNLT